MSKPIKIFSYLIFAIYFFGSVIFPIHAQTVNTYANAPMAGAALNERTGGLIAGENYNEILPLASLTKLMTALILIERGINFNKKIKITAEEVNYVKPYIGKGDVTSSIDLRAGDVVTVNDLWHAMLIASSNEAAVALVDHSGLTRAQFVARMNREARALGLRHMKFTEPTGIDPRNAGTARETAVIARQAFLWKMIRLVGVERYFGYRELSAGRKINIYNRNTSLLAMKPYGMKVGYLTEARDNVAVRLRRGNKDRVIVVLHALNNARRNAEINRLMK